MRIRHGTTTPVIDSTEWNQNHVLAAHDLGSVSGVVAIDPNNGSLQTAMLVGDTTFTLPPVPAGTTENLTLLVRQDFTGGHIIVLPGAGTVGDIAPINADSFARSLIFLVGAGSEGWFRYSSHWIDPTPPPSGGGGGSGSGWLTRIHNTTQTLANDTNDHLWFQTISASVALEANSLYEFDGCFRSLNGTTSHGLRMFLSLSPGLTGEWSAIGAKAAANGEATAQRFGAFNNFDTSRLVTTASTVGGNIVYIKGTVRTTTEAFMHPHVRQSAASGSFVVQPGTYFKVRRLGGSAFVVDGWELW